MSDDTTVSYTLVATERNGPGRVEAESSLERDIAVLARFYEGRHDWTVQAQAKTCQEYPEGIVCNLEPMTP